MKVKRPHLGRHHNLIRAAHNDDTHKYEKQKTRTAINKIKHETKAKLLKKQADAKRASRAEWLKGLCWPKKG